MVQEHKDKTDQLLLIHIHMLRNNQQIPVDFALTIRVNLLQPDSLSRLTKLLIKLNKRVEQASNLAI